MCADIRDSVSQAIKDMKSIGVEGDVLAISTNKLSASSCQMSIEEAISSDEQLVGIRVIKNKKQASSVTSKCNNVSDMVKHTASMAEQAPEDPYIRIALERETVKTPKDLDIYEGKDPSMEYLAEQAIAIEKATLSIDGVTKTRSSDAEFSSFDVVLANTNGFLHTYQKSYYGFSSLAIAGSGNEMQSDYDFIYSCKLDTIENIEDIGLNAAKRAIRKTLSPKKIKTAVMPVFLSNVVADTMLDNFASAINGNAIKQGNSFLTKNMGEKIFSEYVTISDNPLLPSRIGSHPFDSEGIEGKDIKLVNKGILSSWILDISSAEQLKLSSTGHAHTTPGNAPSPATSNIFMECGEMTPDDLIKKHSKGKNGIYITGLLGFGVNIVNGNYSQGAEGFLIEDGEITDHFVQQITIAGSLQDMFMAAEPANDLLFIKKNNSPTVFIGEMTISSSES